MEYDFVPYDIAHLMLHKGFKEYCHALWLAMAAGPRLISVGGHWGSAPSSGMINVTDFTLESHEIPAPSYNQAIEWADSLGYNLHIVPELYYNGINWHWQWSWYKPKEEWGAYVYKNDAAFVPRNVFDGTGLYGDNGEYKTRREAMDAALRHLLKTLL